MNSLPGQRLGYSEVRHKRFGGNVVRVAVIAPPYPLEEAPPLGICYVAAAFEAAGAQVRIFDYVVAAYSKGKLEKQLKDFKPQVAGSTSVTLNFYQAARIIADAKAIDPSIITLMGGPHVSFCAEETLSHSPDIDMVVVREGEATIADLVPRLLEKSAWKEVEGIAYREGDSIHITPSRGFLRDLDALPFPARHLLPLSRYKAMSYPISIITGRGCPYGCIFCLGRRMVGPRIRVRDMRLVADEIQGILTMGFDRINIADDLFTSRQDRVAAFCEEIRKRGLSFGWSAFSRVNTLDRKIAKMIHDAGCDWVFFGFESGNQEMLDRIGKAATLEQAQEAVAICKEVGLRVLGSFIVGLPGETPQTLRDTDRFARSLDVSYGYHYLAPFPGTAIMEKTAQYDLEILSRNWSKYDANQPVVRTSRVSTDDTIRFVERYEKEIEQLWQELEEGYGTGVNSPHDDSRVEGRRRIGLVYEILSQDLVEAHGALPPSGPEDPRAALDTLCERITDATGRGRDMVDDVLGLFVSRGLIETRKDGESLSWSWTLNPSLTSNGCAGS
ncbi:B12-binding domain-containing radical SAM protein [Thermodesulfobacteriota bacterium]